MCASAGRYVAERAGGRMTGEEKCIYVFLGLYTSIYISSVNQCLSF